MILYIILALYMEAILLLSLNNKAIRNNSEYSKTTINSIYFITFVLLWFLTAFRAKEIGNDTIPYIEIFKTYSDIKNISIHNRVEIGWQILCFIISKIWNNPAFFIFCISTALYILAGTYIYKYSNNILMSLVIFFSFYFGSFLNILRQSLAVCILAFAFQSLLQDKKKKAFWLIILASCFHTTSLVALLLFLSKIINKLTTNLLLPFVGLLSLISMSSFFNLIASKILPSKYIVYLESAYYHSGYIAVTVSIVTMVFIYLWARDNKERLWHTNFAILLLINALGYYMNLFTRASLAFQFIAVLSFPNFINEAKTDKKKWIAFIFCSLELAYFLVILILRPNWNHLYPYKFIWN